MRVLQMAEVVPRKRKRLAPAHDLLAGCLVSQPVINVIVAAPLGSCMHVERMWSATMERMWRDPARICIDPARMQNAYV